VPLLVLGSGVEPGVVEAQTIHEDVAAAVLARAGVSRADLDGKDLLAGASHERVTIHTPEGEAERTTADKRVRWTSGAIEVFDLVRDPYEMSPRTP